MHILTYRHTYIDTNIEVEETPINCAKACIVGSLFFFLLPSARQVQKGQALHC